MLKPSTLLGSRVTAQRNAVNVTLLLDGSGSLVDGLSTDNEDVGLLLSEDIASGVLEVKCALTEIDFEWGRIDDLHGVLELSISEDFGLKDGGLWAIHSWVSNSLLVNDLGLHSERLNRTDTIVKVHFVLLVQLQGLAVCEVSVHIDDLDELVFDVDKSSLGVGLDFWEVEFSERSLWTNHVDGHWGECGWERTSVSGLGLNRNDEGVSGSLGDLDERYLKL